MADPRNRRIKRKVLAKMADKVKGNRRAVAAARIHPRLRRGKKVPPLSLVPPRPADGKKVRYGWQMAVRSAEAQAEDEATNDPDTE